MKIKRQGGFTLIEVIVVAGIIAILAGILVPLIFKEIDESKISRAYADVRSISNAMIIFRKDTGQWPAKEAGTCAEKVTLLVGDGAAFVTLPAGYDDTVQSTYNDYLPADNNGCWATWKGPYMARVNADPWGHTYVTNVADLYNGSGLPVWIISGGPNGAITTQISAAQPILDSDDVGIRLQ